MADTAARQESDTGQRRPVRPARRLLLGAILFAATGAAAFQTVRLDLISPDMLAGKLPFAQGEALDGAFVALDPIVVNVPAASESAHLRFAAQLEVARGAQDAVLAQMPRILDVLNDYLRALDPERLDERAALMRLRAQMLRRVQVVTGDGAVRDLLITEFVMN